METKILFTCIVLTGLGQMFTAIIYPFVRYRVLDWFIDLKNLKPLNEAIAKTYGYYIQGINFAFGFISIALVKDLMVESRLTITLVGFITLYWIGRISFQLKGYTFEALSEKKHIKTGIWSMNILIVFFALTYLSLFIYLITS